MNTVLSKDDPRLFHITSDNLWVVWSRRPAVFIQLDPTKPQVRTSWMLASEGEAGVEELMSEFPVGFIAAASLSTLEVAWALLSSQSDAHPSWVRSALRLHQPTSFVLGRGEDGKIHLMSKNKVKSGVEVLLSGSIEDLQALVIKGRKTLSGPVPDWKAILGDARACAQTQPVKWFEYQRSPQCAAYLEEILKGG